MVDSLREAYERDRNVWDSCAGNYEDQIICGHPDIVAYEAFEEDFLDRILLYLVRECGVSVELFDVGCGSGRLHLRYGLKVTDDADLDPDLGERLRRARQSIPGSEYDALLARRLRAVRGLDFSESMIKLAEKKLAAAGLGPSISTRLFLRVGSGFDLKQLRKYPVPVAVSLCNSIGVMQGPSGAVELFKAMRRAVESAGGIAIISAYAKQAVETFALGNYESTMNVCGQPLWLEPDTYADSSYTQVPRAYKRAHDPDRTIRVDVFDQKGQLLKEKFMLRRSEPAVQQVIETGHIETHSDYESYWYSFEQFEEWIDSLWPKRQSYHLVGKNIDALRAEPAQIAILDAGGRLERLLNRWQGV